MKIIRKKREGIKIEYNKKLFWIIIVLLAILILLIYFIAKNDKADKEGGECKIDEDCAPATCCHPDSCAPVEKAPECKNIMCSMVCSGPLDCNAGSCSCVKGKCEVIPNG